MLKLEITNPGTRNSSRGRIGQPDLPSAHQKANRNTGANGSRTSTTSEVQPMDRPRRRPTTRQSRPAINVTAPVTSKLGPPTRCGPRSSQMKPKTIASTTNGTRARKTASQPNHWTSRPAPRVAINIPAAWLAAVSPIPRPRRRAGNRRATMAGETAYRQPVPRACTTLKATIVPRFGDRAMAIMATR